MVNDSLKRFPGSIFTKEMSSAMKSSFRRTVFSLESEVCECEVGSVIPQVPEAILKVTMKTGVDQDDDIGATLFNIRY